MTKIQQNILIGASIGLPIILTIVFWKSIYNFYIKKILGLANAKLINELHPKFRFVTIKFLKEIKDKLGYEAVIIDAGRTLQESEQYAQQGIGAKYSYHNVGLAIDVVFVKDGKIILDKSSGKDKWKQIVDIAKKYNLQWGGEFTDVAYDPVHFDYRYLVNKKLPSELIAEIKAGKVDKEGFIKV